MYLEIVSKVRISSIINGEKRKPCLQIQCNHIKTRISPFKNNLSFTPVKALFTGIVKPLQARANKIILHTALNFVKAAFKNYF